MMFSKLHTAYLRTGVAALLSLLTTTLWSQNVKVDFRQSANNDAGYGPGAIHWISSILQSGNSSYAEGMSTLQRVVLLNVPATTGNIHSLQLGHQFTKGGHHAYDFLTGNSLGAETGWNVAYSDYNDYLSSSGVTAESILSAWECAEEIGPPADMANICADLHNPAIGYYFDVELPDDPFISIDGSLQSKIDAYEAVNGNRYIRVYGDQVITNGYFTCVQHTVPDLGDGGDSYSNYTLVVETASTSIIIELGGHLAMGGLDNSGMNWGPNLGSGSINGGPYHFKLYGIGGSVNLSNCTLNEFTSLGAQDNQITAGDIIPLTCDCSIVGSVGPVCPNSNNSYCAPQNAVTSNWSISGNGSISGSGNCIQVIAESACGESYTLTLSYTNNEGCSSECNVTVMVEDNQAPIIDQLPGASTIDCPATPEFAQATANDACGDVELSYEDVISAGSCAGNYNVTRTWTATDACGNSSNASQTINVQDVTAPVIGELPGASTIDCPATPEFAQANANDACGDVELSYEDVISAGSCAGNYSVTRTWTATDACGNSSNASQTINVQDVTAPVIGELPGASTIDCPATPEFAQANANDACGDVELSYEDVISAGSCAGNYSVTRTWTATDACGNSSNASQTINVQDVTAPVIGELPGASTIDCPATPEFAQANANDACGDVELSYEDVISAGSCAGNYSVTRTWTATDACGNSSNASQTINVQDVTAPVIGELPGASTIDCPATPEFAQANANDACGDVELSYEDVISAGSCAGNYSVTRTWTATDACSNSSNASQTINVQDVTAPVIGELPGASTIDCPATPEFAQANANDACGDVELSYEDVISAGSCAGNYSVTRTWTATDACGNSSNASQTINVQDVTAPVIGELPGASTIDCPAAPEFAQATANDACGDAELSYEDVISAGSCAGNYSVTRTWTATDACGNNSNASQTINVQDVTAPTVENALADQFIQCEDEIVYNEPSFSDACDNNLDISYEVDTIVISRGTRIIRRFTATDDCGNSVTDESEITIVIDNNPVLINLPELSLVVECNQVPAPPVLEGRDVCGNNLEVSYEETTDGDNCNATITRTWYVIDGSGNDTTFTQVVTVQDTTAPVISAAGENATIECPAQPEFSAPSASDDCNSAEVVVVSDEITPSCGNSYSRTITWKAIDACGNESSTVSQTITVVDTTAPIIAAPADVIVACASEVPAAESIEANDNCSEVEVSSADSVISYECENRFVVERVYTATDACGNSSTASQIITVYDNIAPVFESFASAEFNCTNGAGSTEVVATDNCGNVELTYIDEIPCEYTTYSKGGWGSPSTSTPGQYRDNNFDAAFPDGLTIGCESGSYTFTSAQSIEDFLPSGGGASVLPAGNIVNPDADIVSNNFADQLIAAMLNTGFDAYDEDFGGSNINLGNLAYASGPYAGMSAYQVIEIANDVIGGCSNAYSATSLLTAMEQINLSFHEGGESSGALECGGNEENECSYIVNRIWTATDACGNSSTAIQTITITDNEAPVLSGAGANLVIECPAVPAFTAPIATDNCSEAVVLEISDVTVEEGCSYTRTITWAAEDACGNRSELVSQSITVIDNSAPVFSNCPNSITVNCTDEIPAVYEGVEAFDNCSDSVYVQYAGETVQNDECVTVITRTWVASDLCGNSSECTQTITLVDTTDPVFAPFPTYVHVTCAEIPGMPVANDDCSNVTIEIIEESVQSGSCMGVLYRVYKATDACGNYATAEQFISIIDTIAPVLIGLPANNTVECSDVSLNDNGGVVASDDCAQNISVIYTEQYVGQDDDCPETFDIIRTWVAVDICENEVTATRTTHVEDTTSPEFINFPADITISCDDEIPAIEYPTAVDNCDGDVEMAMTQDQMPGTCPQNYFIYRTFRGYDNCGNERVETQTITVVDETAPVFAEQPNTYYYECNTAIPLIEPTANDNCGQVTLTYVDAIPSVEGPACEVPMQRVWTATDECGNASEFTQLITIVDTQAPIVNSYEIEVDMPCDAVSNEIMISATDCNEVIITFTDEYVSGSCAGRIIRTYSVSDACGNVTSGLIQQIINLIDVSGPAVEVAPIDLTIECGEIVPAYVPVWSDNCAEELELAAASSISADECTTVITENWTAVDPCGNSTTVSRTVTIIDSTAPVFTFVPENDNRDCTSEDVISPAYADDNCSDVTITRNDVIVPGACPSSYTIERIYTATDACGNYTSYTQLINVSDNNGPQWGENQTSFVYECGSESDLVTPVAFDNCSEFTLSHSDGQSIEYGCAGAFERTWIAIDACGNESAPFVQFISFEDTTEPMLSGCPSDLVLNCNDEIPAPAEVTAFDGCDANVQVYFEELFLGDAPAEGSIADCNLITPIRAAGNPCGYPYDWAMALFNMPSVHRWYQVVDGSLVQYPGGSIHLVAQLQNVLTAGTGWNVDVWFNGGMDWSAWSNQGFPTSFKADCGGVDANFASWTYFLLQAGEGAELTGYGNYEGSSINLVHAPANNYFGYQLGDGANNYNNAENGFGGWFSYSGTFRSNTNNGFTNVSGAGDFAFELDCCPDYTIERQWTAVDCSGNASTCTQTISFSSNATNNGGNEGQSTIDTEAISNERVSSTIEVAPNPANNNTVFTFKAAYAAKTTIEMFDITGKKVADVFMGTVEAGDSYNVNFNVNELATGVYTYRLTNGSDVKIDRLIIKK